MDCKSAWLSTRPRIDISESKKAMIATVRKRPPPFASPQPAALMGVRLRMTVREDTDSGTSEQEIGLLRGHEGRHYCAESLQTARPNGTSTLAEILIKRAAAYLMGTGDAPIILLWQPRSQCGWSPTGECLNANTQTCQPLGKACVLKDRYLLEDRKWRGGNLRDSDGDAVRFDVIGSGACNGTDVRHLREAVEVVGSKNNR
ncbi:hypothetical protein N9L68_07550 [bacterium]|nr:hypothetical protein [bacterium]